MLYLLLSVSEIQGFLSKSCSKLAAFLTNCSARMISLCCSKKKKSNPAVKMRKIAAMK